MALKRGRPYRASEQEAEAAHHSLDTLKLLVKTTWQTNSAECIRRLNYC